MYNHIRRCLVTTIKSKRKVLTHDGIISHKTNYCINVHCISNNINCKRFYCQAPFIAENNKSDISMQDDVDQQKLDEILSEPENKKLFQILELELDVMRHNAAKVPEKLGPREWLLIMEMTTKTRRQKYLKYLWTVEKVKENRKEEKEEKRAEWLAKKAEEEANPVEDTGEMKYGLSYNTLFLRIYEQTMKQFYNSRLIQALLFEPKIVFDCGYEDYMNATENHNCAKQLTLAFAYNRYHVNPMSLYFCNLNKENALRRNWQRNMPNLYDVDFPSVVTSQSYLDLFPKDKLVYLTPHCKTDMIEYDSDMVYIIGAMVDKSKPQPLSLAKAKKEGIRMLKLPIEKYLDWGSGSTKNLTLDQVLRILLDIRHTKKWEDAMKNVPTRKLKPAREFMLKKKLEKFQVSEEASNAYYQSDRSFTQQFTFSNRRRK